MQTLCARIGMEVTANKDYRIFHFKTKLLFESCITDMLLPGGPSHPPAMLAMYRELISTEGVDSVTIWPYKVSIEKAEMYNWDEIIPSLKKVFAWRFPSKPAV